MDSFQEDAKTAIQMYGQTIRIQKLLVETAETIQTILDCYEEIFGYVTAVIFGLLCNFGICNVFRFAEYS